MKENNVRAVLVYEDSQREASPPAILIKESLKRLRQAFGKVPLFSNIDYNEKEIKNLGYEKGILECLRSVQAETCTKEHESIALCYSLYPLLDLKLVQEALQDHQNYLAHFTYGENIPSGLIPDLVSKDFIDELPSLKEGEKKDSIENEDLRAFVLKNIEKYDVEIFYKKPDLRQYRLDFSIKSPRSQKLAEEILKSKPELDFPELLGFIQNNAEILRPYPSYFEIQLSEKMPLKPFYFPEKKSEKKNASSPSPPCELSMELVQKLIEDLKSNGMEGDASLALGGLGEPAEHPHFLDILSSFLELKQVQRIYIESFGVKLDQSMLRSLASLKGAGKLHIILRLNSLQRERYKEMYEADLFPKVHENIRLIESMSPEKRVFHVYAEMIRMRENDDEIDAYFERFKKSPIEVILQKYNRYIDLLPERRAVDLNPLCRSFCWHLTRDFYLKADGQVPLCKQDPFGKRAPSLSFKEHSVKEILAKTMKAHISSIQQKHERTGMPCLQCDEWYTFNG